MVRVDEVSEQHYQDLRNSTVRICVACKRELPASVNGTTRVCKQCRRLPEWRL